MAIFWFFKTATAQQTMQPLVWVYDQSYTHKSGQLISNMVIYHFLLLLNFFQIFLCLFKISNGH